MIEFIIGYITLFISIVVSIILYKRLQPKWLQHFTWFLLFTLLIQFAGFAYSYYIKKSNHFIFNFYILIQFLFYFFLFYKTFEKINLKRFTVLLTLLFVLYYTYNMLFGSGFFIFSTSSNTVGSVLIIVCCLLYFVSLFMSELNLNYFRIPMFWIATGLLFYFTGNTLYLSLTGYIVKHHLDTEENFYVLMVILNFILYGSFTSGLLSNQVWKNGMSRSR